MIDLSKDWTGEDVQMLLSEHGLGQRALARLLGLRVNTINEWMTGTTTPSRIALIALSYIALDLAGKLTVRNG